MDEQKQSRVKAEVEEHLARRKNSMVAFFRGDNFTINLYNLFESKQALKTLEILRQRNCELDIDSVSYRTLHHWDSSGLIECGRESPSGWRKFNLAELLWIHVIAKFREMGISLDKISKAKEFFFEQIPGYDLKYVEYYFLGAVYFKAPAFFITLSDGQSEFLTYLEMTHATCMKWLDNCVSIHLNPLLNNIFKKIDVKSEFPTMRPVSFEQHQICDVIETEEFDSMRIIKEKGKISGVEIEKGFSPQASFTELKEDLTNGAILTRYHDGRPSSKQKLQKFKVYN